MTEGDILWGIKSIHGLDIDASEDIPIASFPRRRDYKAVPVTTDMHALLNAAVDQNFVPVVDDRNVFIGIVRRTAILQQVAKDYESPKGNVFPENNSFAGYLDGKGKHCVWRLLQLPASTAGAGVKSTTFTNTKYTRRLGELCDRFAVHRCPDFLTRE